MNMRPILSSNALAAAQTDLPEMLRSRIRTLLADPGVADRVSRRLRNGGTRNAIERPECFSPAAGTVGAGRPAISEEMTCHDMCGSIDCLCGRYPRWLSGKDVRHGPKLEQFAL